MRYFIKLSFNGRQYHGWQVQENAPSVQEELNKALSLLLREEIKTTGCGRTDTGVHAKMFFAHIDTAVSFSPDDLMYQLNAILSRGIAIHSIFAVADDSHARFSAITRTYQYFLHDEKNPFLDGISWFYPHLPDLEKMNAAAKILAEYTDFSAFSKSHTQTFTNNCKIQSAHWRRIENQFVFEITADRFLRNMVRAIVGTLLDVGLSKMDENDFRSVLESKERSRAGTSVPAHGLFLTDIVYPFISV